MRTLSAASMLVLAVALGATVGATNQEEKPKDPKLAIVVVERIQDLNLTDAQEAKLAAIQKEFQPKVQEAAKEFGTLVKDEMEKVGAVLTPEQKKKLEELKEERTEHRQECVAHVFARLKDLDLTDAEMAKIGELRKEYGPKIEKAMKGLEGVLNNEQKKARAEALKAGKKRGEILAALQLTGEQKEKLETVGKDVAALVREEVEKIHEVLTESQKQQLPDAKEERKEHVRDRMAHRIANFKDLNLTEDQKTKLASIREEYRPKIHEAGNKLRGLLRDEMKEIVGVMKA